MSYSKSKNNVFGLTDEQIDKYYLEAVHKKYGNKNVIISFIPLTAEGHLNPNFHMDSVVKFVNEYLIAEEYVNQCDDNEFIKLTNELTNIKKRMNEVEKQIKHKLINSCLNNLTRRNLQST